MVIAERFGDVTWEGAKQTALGSKLAAGDKAPDFSVSDHLGKRVSLADLRGKTVVLWFFPKADTPG